MADPVVHITNGIPDLGTGNITTLGQTLLDGANATLGMTTDVAIAAGAAGTINAHLRSISRDIAAGVVLQPSSNLIGNVGQSGAPWSQNVTQFGGAAVVTGTGIGGAGIPRVTVSSDSSLAATQSGSWDIRNITGSVPLPTGASTSAKQPSLGTAGVPSADVLTVQGVTSMTPLKVDGTGGTFPVSGTVTANQGGTWNITNVSGTVSLPTGAATAAKQPAPSTAGSPSADVLTIQGASGMTALKTNLFGNSGNTLDCSSAQNQTPPTAMVLVGAEFNTTPTTITSGNASPLQLDSAGNLLVNVKAGGASGGTSSGFGSAFPASGTAVGAKDSTGSNMAALNLDASGNLKVNVAAGGASGGTSSSFGSAIPATGTAAGYSDGTNMQLARVFDGDTGAGTQYSLGVLLKTPASGGAVDIGVSGQPLRVDPTGTTTQPVSGTVTVTQGTAANLNATVTGTVAATQSGTWNITNISGTVSLPTGAATSANQPTAAALGSTTSGQTGNLSLGAVTTAAPTYTNLQTNALSLTTAGALRVDGSGVTQPVSGTVNAAQSGTWNITNISGTVSLPTGAATAANQCTAAGSASTTSGQTGHLAMGAATTGSPAYTTGQTNPLSLTLAGALRVDASATTQPISGTITANQGGTWTVQPGNTANTTAWLVTGSGGTFPATQSGTWNITNISGTISLPTGAATSANQPSNIAQAASTASQTGTLAMGIVTTANPTYTTGTINGLSLDTSGAVRVNVIAGSGGGGTSSSFGSSFPTTGTAIGVMNSAGTAMTNMKVNASNALLVDGSAVTQPVSGTFWQATQPVSIAASVTVQQATASNLNCNVSGTVAATQSGNWTSRIVGNGGAVVDGVIGAATAPANMLAVGGVFNTTKPTLTTGQSSAIQLNASGIQLVDLSSTGANATAIKVDGSAVTQPISGTINAAQSGNWQARILGNAGAILDAVIGAATAPANMQVTGAVYNTSRPSLTTGQSAALQFDSTAALIVNGSQYNQPVTGVGNFTVVQATAANLNATVTGTVAATQSGTWNIATVSNITGMLTVNGDVASGTTDANNPIKVGVVAQTSLPTAVSAGQRVNVMGDTSGRMVVVGAIRNQKQRQKTNITTTTETSISSAPGAGKFLDCYGIICTNSSATATIVDFRDSTGGNIQVTLSIPAGDTRGFTMPIDAAIMAVGTNTNWTAQPRTAVSSVEITFLGVITQ